MVSVRWLLLLIVLRVVVMVLIPFVVVVNERETGKAPPAGFGVTQPLE